MIALAITTYNKCVHWIPCSSIFHWLVICLFSVRFFFFIYLFFIFRIRLWLYVYGARLIGGGLIDGPTANVGSTIELSECSQPADREILAPPLTTITVFLRVTWARGEAWGGAKICGRSHYEIRFSVKKIII